MFKKIDSLIAFINGDIMLLAMPNEDVKITNRNSSKWHFDIMEDSGKDSTKEEFKTALEQCNKNDNLLGAFIYFERNSK